MNSNGTKWPQLARVLRGLRRSAFGRAVLGPQAESWVDISDEYAMWLCFANPGMTHRGNLHCLDHAMAGLAGDAPIVEIGAFCGLSTNLLAYYRWKRGRRNPIIACDRWDFEYAQPGQPVGNSLITHDEYRSFVKESFLRNIRLFSRPELPQPVEMTSDEFFAAWRRRDQVKDLLGRPLQLGGPISFAVIDGNHTYEFARRDFQNSDEFLLPGGFIFLDDSSDDSRFEGVRRVVKEVQSSGRYELAARNPHYLFRKLLRE